MKIIGKSLIIKGADFSAVAVGQITPPIPINTPTITISASGVVMLSANEATAIYYTIDKSTPTKSSTKYTAAFTISSGTTVKAIAEFADGSTSGVSSKTYTSTGGQWLRGYSDSQLEQGNVLSLAPNTDWEVIMPDEDKSKVFTKIKFYAKETGNIILGGKMYNVSSTGINIIDLSPAIIGQNFTINAPKRSYIIGINGNHFGFGIETVGYYFPIDIYYE